MSNSGPYSLSRRKFVRRAGGAALAAVLAPAAARSAPSSRPDSPGSPAVDTAMLPSLTGRFPVVARTSRGRDVYALTPENFHSLHAYFDRSPLDASQRKLVYFRVADRQAGQGEVVLLDVQSGDDEMLLEMVRPETFADGTRNATHGHPVWTRDDRAVIFNAQPGRNSQIFIMPV